MVACSELPGAAFSRSPVRESAHHHRDKLARSDRGSTDAPQWVHPARATSSYERRRRSAEKARSRLSPVPAQRKTQNQGASKSTMSRSRVLDSANSSSNLLSVSGRGSNFELALRFSRSMFGSGSSPMND